MLVFFLPPLQNMASKFINPAFVFTARLMRLWPGGSWTARAWALTRYAFQGDIQLHRSRPKSLALALHLRLSEKAQMLLYMSLWHVRAVSGLGIHICFLFPTRH